MLETNSKTAIRNLILASALETITAIMKQPVETRWDPGMDRLQAAHERQRRREAESSVVDYEPARWLNRPLDEAERKAFSRELAAMEEAGLIFRLGDNGRTTQLRLLPAGESAALALAEAQR